MKVRISEEYDMSEALQEIKDYLDKRIDFSEFENRILTLAWTEECEEQEMVNLLLTEIVYSNDGLVDEKDFRERVANIVTDQPAPSRIVNRVWHVFVAATWHVSSPFMASRINYRGKVVSQSYCPCGRTHCDGAMRHLMDVRVNFPDETVVH